jgi:hypothetical protein
VINWRLALAGVVAAASIAPPVHAQTEGEAVGRPARRVPVVAAPQTESGQTLTLSLASLEAYDSNVLAETAGVGPNAFQESGFYTGLSPSVSFKFRGQRVQFNTSGGSNLRYYGDLGRMTVVNHYAAMGLSSQLGRRTNVAISQGTSYSPSYLAGLFARGPNPVLGDVVETGTNYAVNSERAYAYGLNATITQRTSRYGVVSFASGVRRTKFQDQVADFSQFRSYDLGTGYTHRVSRNSTFNVSYRYQVAKYPVWQLPSQHDANVGIEYRLPQSSTRTTVFGFGVGASAINGRPQDPNGREFSRYQVTANASLTHPIGQTWRIQESFNRGQVFIEGLSDPVSTDALMLSVDGSLSAWVDLFASGAYTTGISAFTRDASRFTTYTADAQLRFMMTPLWSTYIEYLQYFYDFSNSVRLPSGISPTLTRKSVRFGLMLNVPMRRQ